MQYMNEFPHYDDVLILPAEWIDASWHNDVSPSFERDIGDIKYKIWCDFKDPNRREVGGKQFTVATYDQNEFEYLQDLAEFDNLSDALFFVEKETQK
jgi:hypothetical protein